MELTTSQQNVLDATLNAKRGQSVILRGFAGTGKSVTASKIIESFLKERKSVMVLTPTAAALSVLRKKLSNYAGSVQFKTIASLMTRHQSVLKFKDVLTFYPTLEDGPELEALQESSIHNLKNVFDVIEELNTMFSAANPEIQYEDIRSCFTILYSKQNNKEYIKSRDELAKYYKYIVRTDGADKVSDYLSIIIDTQSLSKLVTKAYRSDIFDPIVYDSEFDMKSIEDIKDGIYGYDLVVIDEMSMVGKEQASAYDAAVSESPVASEADQILGIEVEDTRPITLISGDPGQLEPVNSEFNHWCEMEIDGETVFELNEVLRSTDEIANIGQVIRQNLGIRQIADIFPQFKTYKRDTQLNEIYQDNEQIFKDCDVALAFTNASVKLLNDRMRYSKGLIGPVQAGDKVVINKNDEYFAGSPRYTNGTILSVEQDLTDEIISLLQQEVDLHKDDLYMVRNQSQILDALKFGKIKYVLCKDDEDAVYAFFMNAIADKFNSRESSEIYAILKGSNFFEKRRELNQIVANALGSSIENTELNLSLVSYRLIDARFAHAMTVHKSQGSQFKKVIYVVSGRDLWIQRQNSKSKYVNAPVYVAVTRAQDEVNVFYIE